MAIKKKKVKKLTYAKAKKQTWDAFSLYIRTRDSHNGQVECFTCEYVYPVKETQAGHFVPGRHNSVLFDDRNCHVQCMRCNVFLKGNLIKYYPKMVRRYGADVIEELENLDLKSKQYKVFELLEIRDLYKTKLEELSKE